MLLYDSQQLPLPDVAKWLGVSVPAAKSRLLRAGGNCAPGLASIAGENIAGKSCLQPHCVRPRGFAPVQFAGTCVESISIAHAVSGDDWQISREIMEVIEAAGARLVIPAQTTYLAVSSGSDRSRAEPLFGPSEPDGSKQNRDAA